MSENLEMTERLMEAVGHLNRAERLLVMEGAFDSLEQLAGWSPTHYTTKIEKELAEKNNEVERLRELLNRAIGHIYHLYLDIDPSDDPQGHAYYKKEIEDLEKLTRLALTLEEPTK